LDIIRKFKDLNIFDFPDFDTYETPLERGLWILWVAKEKLGIKKLNAEQIASVIRDVKEITMDEKSITQSFNRAGDKIHVYREDGTTLFEIMKPGKEYLFSRTKEGSIELFYFEPSKCFTSKRILSRNILNTLSGELRIVDPYCGERTLDILKDIKDRKVKFLTRLDNLSMNDRTRFLRELQDFKSEYGNVEFRSYPLTDIHDRYILSSNFLAILGHSIKNLGSKESFAIVMSKDTSRNIADALSENFERRWKQSEII